MRLEFEKTLATAAVLAAAMGAPSVAQAQMSNSPWGFTAQNRASIAALMRQVEEGSDSTDSGIVQLAQPNHTSSLTNLVCGSDAKTSAKGNTTCIILNNAAGEIDVGQDAQGNQTSDASNLGDVLETLSEGSEQE